jgi:hypothetical protein
MILQVMLVSCSVEQRQRHLARATLGGTLSGFGHVICRGFPCHLAAGLAAQRKRMIRLYHINEDGRLLFRYDRGGIIGPELPYAGWACWRSALCHELP